MNTNAEQIYSSTIQIDEHFVTIPTNQIIHHQASINGDTSDFQSITSNPNVNIVNYLPNLPVTIINSELHHQNHHQYIKKCDANFIQAKEQSHMIQIYGDGSNNIMPAINGADLPVLTPLKYIDYPNIVSSTGADEQILMTTNDDGMSEKSDCESLNNELNKLPMKNVKRSLPHKKRIAKKLGTDEFSIILSTDDTNMRLQAPQFECTECGLSFMGQLEFYMHLKEHYEGSQSSIVRNIKRNPMKRQHEDLEIHHVHEEVPENLIIESLEDSQDTIKSEGIEGDAFGFSEPEDMEDFRKEVEKVVETIGETELHDEIPDASWNYQVPEEAEENSVQIENFNEKIDDTTAMEQSNFPTNQQDMKCDTYLCSQNIKDEDAILLIRETSLIPQNGEQAAVTDDDDDNKPLEQVRMMLKRTRKYQKQKVQNDEEVEFNECLKKIQNFKCNDCNKCFNSRTALGYHLKTHSSERRYVCDQCGKKFLTNGALKVHLRLHTNDRPYKCTFPDCGKSFRQWGDLKYHETSLHSDKKDHICEFCAKAFARKYSLVIHRRIHTGEKTYKCTECEKCFRASSYLLNHKRIHSGERPFACPVCGKKFRVQGDLKRHTKIHDRVKNGIVKEKKKPNDTQTAPVQEASNGMTNECVDLSKESKMKLESNENYSIVVENLTTKKKLDNNEATAKKSKKSHKKKK